jgi:cytochrome P450 enzyme
MEGSVMIEPRQNGEPEIEPSLLQIFAGEDSHALVRRLRASQPVYRVPGAGFWLVTRHDDVRELFRDQERVTADQRAGAGYRPRPEGTYLRWIQERGLLALPPHEHTRIRRLVSAAFTPRAVRRMDAQIRDVVEEFAAPLRGRSGKVIDLAADYADPIPNAVIARITGVPSEGGDDKRFRQLAQAFIRGVIQFSTPEDQDRAESALAELYPWVEKIALERRSAPREDLISDLVQAVDRDDRLDDREVIMLVTGLLAAGSTTTAMGCIAMAATLLRYPDTLERIRADRALIPRAVEEILRFSFGGPGGIVRYALCDFTLRGQQIRKGEMLMLSFGGANRDPAVFPDPDVFDIDRDASDLMVFGGGAHYCLGANLARQELACMLDGLLGVLTPGSKVRTDLGRPAARAMLGGGEFRIEIA